MGIGSQIVEALAKEHAYKPLVGDGLLMGRQTVYYTAPNILNLLHSFGIEPALDPAAIEIDTKTVDRLADFANDELITDTSLLKLFGLNKVSALDHSAYEGAEIVHDLRYPLPDNLCDSTDVLVDGSTLDNVFTPSTVLQNFTRLLRPGGRMFLVNAFSSFESAYVIMPPMWYVDYFVMNGFADCRVYVMLFREGHSNAFYVDLKDIQRLKRQMGFFPTTFNACTIVFAEKGRASTFDRLPIQQGYRQADDWAVYDVNLETMLASDRPHLARSNSVPFIFDAQGGYHYINQNFTVDDGALAAFRAGPLTSSNTWASAWASVARRLATSLSRRTKMR